jgi:hypothetical protein
MSKLFAIATIALAAISSVSGAAIPRATPPQGWETDVLEPYDVYHERYMALYCYTQHSQPFFDQCCHPMLKTETLEKNRGPQCVPRSPAFTSAMQAQPVPSSTPASPAPSSVGDDDDAEDCDDEEPESTFVPSSSPAPKPSSTTFHPSPTTTPKPSPTTTPKPSPTTTPKPSPTTTYSSSSPPSSSKHSSSSPQPSPTPDSGDDSGSGGGEVFSGGFATYYYQNGVAGACGKVNPDSAFIAALQTDMYGALNKQSSHCGQQIKVTNKKNGKSVIATVADACPTCVSSTSVDLSYGAFTQIATTEEGMVGISWEFI